MKTEQTNLIDIHVAPHPFRAAVEHRRLPAGESVAALVMRLQPDSALARHAHVYIDGDYVPQDKWKSVKPKAGAQMAMRFVPMGGGGGKNPLRTILTLAAMAATGMMSSALGAAMGLNALPAAVGGFVKGGLSMLARLALGALIPPPKQRFNDSKRQSPTLFIQGARNQATPFGRVPKVLGRHRFVPPLGALPYTETVGDDQYLRMLFVWGYGPLDISELKIGETPLSDFTDVEIETRQGYPDDAPITLYTDSILQNDLQVKLTQAVGAVSRTTEMEADEISVDITFPNGLFRFNDEGGRSTVFVEVTVEYALAGTGDWVSAGSISVSAKQVTALRRGLRFAVPVRGQYDVRLTRLTDDATSTRRFDETAWTALRTIRHAAPITMPGLALTALRIKATDQLSGVIDRFNGVVHSILPDWDGAEWVERTTSNPASIFRHVLQGSANARPLADSRLDLDKIQSWHESCAAANRNFNTVIDYDVSVAGVLQDIAAIGRASPSLIDGKWAVVEDTPQSAPVQHFTPRNTFGFRGAKAFAELPQALRIRFVNAAKGWLQDERLVFDDGWDLATATRYETLELAGVTDADQAWREGRYHIASARLRPETYSFCADVEHIICTRGDLVRFTHDVPMFGLMSGRVKTASETGVTLDAAVTMVAGTSYALRVRLADGTSLLQPVITAPGTTASLTFTVPAEGIAAGDLFLFGESGQESVELLVTAVEPMNDLQARLTCVDAAPAVHAAETGAIPPFTSYITGAPGLERPPAPVIAQIQSGLSVMEAGTSSACRIAITLAAPDFAQPLRLRVSIRAAGETDFRPATVQVDTPTTFFIADVEEGVFYDIRLRHVAEDGRVSPALLRAGYQVEGGLAPPADVEDFNMNVLGGMAYLSWSPVTDADLAGYVLRFSPQLADATWSGAVDLVAGIARDSTSITVPAAAGTFLIKAADAGGRLSENAALAVSYVALLAGFNAVENVVEDETFPGACTCAGVSGGVLMLAGSDSVDDWAEIDDVLNADVGDAGLEAAGVYAFAQDVDLGAVYTSRLTADLAVAGIDTNATLDLWGSVDTQESFDQSADPSLWGVVLELRQTEDDPAATPDWSGWMPFVVGDYTARAFQFRAILSSYAAGVTPAISRLRVTVDMPDRTAADRGLVSAAGGTDITFSAPFHALPAIAITAQNMATGDYYTVTGITSAGFSLRFFNAAGTGVSRTFDYLAKGYGEQL